MAVTMMIVFLSFTALTVDLGHIFVVRNQLQNAADATVLEAVGYLYPATASGAPNWSLAQTSATSAIPRNKVDGIALSNGTITTGYWDLTGVTTTMKATSITPGINDVPALMATISKSSGKNGGPVNLFFGSLLGISTVNVSATAVAAAGAPSSVNSNALFPIAMAVSTYNTYWDSTNNIPRIDPSTHAPYVFHINEGAQGGWTSFNLNSNDTPTIISLITTGNPIPLKIGDQIWMTNGMKTSIYSSVPSNKDVLVAVVAISAPGALESIVAFGALHIDFGIGGSSKYVQAHFTNNYKFNNGNPGGPRYGVYMPPLLVK